MLWYGRKIGIGCKWYEVRDGNLYCINCKQCYLKIDGYCVYIENNCKEIHKSNNCKFNNKEIFTFIGISSACEKGLYLKDNICLKINEKINFNFKINK